MLKPDNSCSSFSVQINKLSNRFPTGRAVAAQKNENLHHLLERVALVIAFALFLIYAQWVLAGHFASNLEHEINILRGSFADADLVGKRIDQNQLFFHEFFQIRSITQYVS